jgi:hypothetical protein
MASYPPELPRARQANRDTAGARIGSTALGGHDREPHEHLGLFAGLREDICAGAGPDKPLRFWVREYAVLPGCAWAALRHDGHDDINTISACAPKVR